MERLYKAPERCWRPGVVLKTELSRINHRQSTEKTLTVNKEVGSGFAATVYQAEDESGDKFTIKAFRPGGFRERFRDAFHQAAWGTALPYRIWEPAVLTTEGWQDVLSRASQIEGLNLYFPKSYGHFYDNDHLRSFAGIFEWLDLEPLKPPIVGTQAHRDYQARAEALKRLQLLAIRMGASQIDRQWDLSTLVATQNARTIIRGDQRVVAIPDTIPGLVVLAPLPFSPGDVSRIWRMLKTGERTSFDKADLNKLDAYLQLHPDQFADLSETVARLTESDHQYRDALPGPFAISLITAVDPEVRKSKRGFIGQTLFDLKKIGALEAIDTFQSTRQAVLQQALDNIPLIGSPLLKLLFNPDYRSHLKALLFNRDYRHQINNEDVTNWQNEGRVNEHHADWLKNHDFMTFVEKPLSILPTGAHRFLTDRHFAQEETVKALSVIKAVTEGFVRVLVDREYARQWLVGMIQTDKGKQLIDDDTAVLLINAVLAGKGDTLTRDVFFTTLGVKLVTAPISIGLFFKGLLTGDRNLTLLAGSQLPGVPKITGFGSGVRLGYLSIRVIYDHLFSKHKKRLLPLREEIPIVLSSGFSVIGNFSAAARMRRELPELTDFLAIHFINEVVSRIPIFGEKGTVGEAWMYEWFYKRFGKQLSAQVVDDGDDHY